MRISVDVEKVKPYFKTIKAIVNELTKIDPYGLVIFDGSDVVVLSPLNSFLVRDVITGNEGVIKIGFDDISWALSMLESFDIVIDKDSAFVEADNFRASITSIIQSGTLTEAEEKEIEILRKAWDSDSDKSLAIFEETPIKNILKLFRKLDSDIRPVEVVANGDFVMVVSHSLVYVKGQPKGDINTILSLKLLAFIDDLSEEEKRLVVNNDGLFVICGEGVMRSKVLHGERDFGNILSRVRDTFQRSQAVAQFDFAEFNRGLTLIKAATSEDFCIVSMLSNGVLKLEGIGKNAEFVMDANVSNPLERYSLCIDFVKDFWDGGEVSLTSENDVFFLVNGDEYLVFSMSSTDIV